MNGGLFSWSLAPLPQPGPSSPFSPSFFSLAHTMYFICLPSVFSHQRVSSMGQEVCLFSSLLIPWVLGQLLTCQCSAEMLSETVIFQSCSSFVLWRVWNEQPGPPAWPPVTCGLLTLHLCSGCYAFLQSPPAIGLCTCCSTWRPFCFQPSPPSRLH